MSDLFLIAIWLKKLNKDIQGIIDRIDNLSSDEELELYQFEEYDTESIKDKIKKQKEAIKTEFSKADELEYFEYWDHNLGIFLFRIHQVCIYKLHYSIK